MTSNGIQAIAGPAPVASSAPGIAGTPKVGNTLSASSGTWSGASAFGYQWRRNGAPIPGATGASYTLVAADATQQITVARDRERARSAGRLGRERADDGGEDVLDHERAPSPRRPSRPARPPSSS